MAANTSQVFYDCAKDSINTELKAFSNTKNQIFIEISDRNPETPIDNHFICFDKETAEAFIAHLKKEIKNLNG